MTTHKTGTREDWLAARLELLDAEKALTRRGDELARQRQELPWVRIDKAYRFDTEKGKCLSLGSLPRTLAAADVSLHVRARLHRRLPGVLGHRRRLQRVRGASGEPRRDALGGVAGAVREAASIQTADGMDASHGPPRSAAISTPTSTFASASSNSAREASNTTTGAKPPHRRQGAEKARRADIPSRTTPDGATLFASMTGTDKATYTRERPGMSAFALEDGVVYHTYSAYARGLDGLWGMYQWLDRAPKGRNETGVWFRRRDEYKGVSLRTVSTLLFADQCNGHDRLGQLYVGDGRYADARRLDDVDGLDADAWAVVSPSWRCRSLACGS